MTKPGAASFELHGSRIRRSDIGLLSGANQILKVYQSQRDCVPKPSVARHELPWVSSAKNDNPNGVVTSGANSPKPKPRWGFALLIRCPRVARASQPWALLRNPVGIREKAFFLNLICVLMHPQRKNFWRVSPALVS